MIDRENTILNLEQNIRWIEDHERHQFPGWGNVTMAMRDAVEFMKEQEAGFSPKEIKMYPNKVWACGNCGHVAVGSADYKAKYCPECGKKVQWGG